MRHFKFLLACALIIISIHVSAQQMPRYVKIATPLAYCIVKLSDLTPVHRDNFIKLAKAGYFDKTTFNRILKGFVIQGGDPDLLYEKGKKLNAQQFWIKPEFDTTLFHKRGVLAMGRDVNPGKESFTTQIYFVDGKLYNDTQLDALAKRRGRLIPPAQREVYKTIGGTPSLDGDYTIFGEIVKNIDFIDKVTAVKVNREGNPDVPVTMKVTVLNDKQAAAELK
ncbi:peptidylprolyl isomerase [Mucilaginibacter myungsuensis]|uniref:peptidylprolyl isomerase n=1 Tax=Mucilaginibacter myungsuensis TaxID=649104 RepID=A0A929PYP2_9SPHI|nr:peptidylprolyl isomerase [Mucilaginibacter myungsuensis]MBE9663532.1 peptidylprolyl isomerase [Mucilaginibacter myungsuensis]MDN3600270.1 peptidylprolyl isomerase [Mucilaginibacter myungsuensis]